MHVDPRIPFAILIFAAVFSAGQAIWGLLSVNQVRRAANRRLATAENTTNIGDLVIELRKQRGLNEKGESIFSWKWLADLILKSGIRVEPRRWALIMAMMALVGAIAPVVMLHKPWFAIPGSLLFGVGGPFLYLQFMAGRRTKMLSLQLPNALEVITRSLEAGHPVPSAVALVGREMPDPIGSEFGMAADEIAYGATLEQAVARIADRCRHLDVDLFAATIRLQERAGGNLVGLLKMLAKTVRERHKMRLKIRAASSEGRVSAYILTGAPICVFIFLQVASPHFYGDVWDKKFIQYGLAIMGTWMLIGNLIMRKMIDMRI